MSKTRVICIKSASRPNDWWVCSENDSQNLTKLLDKCKKSGKEETVEYENVKGEKLIFKGHPDKGIIWYKENEKSRVHIVIPVVVPEHPGLEKRKNSVKARIRSRSRMQRKSRR